MSKVLDWVKANVFTVVFIVLMIAAVLVLPIITKGMNADIKKEVEARVAKQRELDQLTKTSVAMPGNPNDTRQVVVNEALLADYRASVEMQKGDAEAIYELAVEHNRKGRGVLMPEMLPQPPADQVEVMPRRFHERLTDAYQALLQSVGAGEAPAPAAIKDVLTRHRDQFLNTELAGRAEAELDEGLKAKLQEKLTEHRTSLYVQRSEELSFYVTPGVPEVPRYDHSRLPPLTQVFDWQWDYWIHEDILRALAVANQGADSVATAPVKRIEYIGIVSNGVSGAGGGGGGDAGFGAGGFGAQPAPPESPSAQGTVANARLQAALNYAVSHTGRTTNQLYDVRNVNLVLHVDATRIPEVINAISQYNFMTVIEMSVEEIDAYDALAEGFYYGSGTFARLYVVVETVWLREWTPQFMPDAYKQALGIALQKPDAAAASG